MAQQELMATVRDRYRASSKREKSRILDEFIPELTYSGDRPPSQAWHQAVGAVRQRLGGSLQRKYGPSAVAAATEQRGGRFLIPVPDRPSRRSFESRNPKSLNYCDVSPVLRSLISRVSGNDGICEHALVQPHPPQRVCVPGHDLCNPRRQATKIIGRCRDQPSGQRPAFV